VKIAVIGYGKSGKTLLPTLLADSEVSHVDVYDTDSRSFDSSVELSNRLLFHCKEFDFNEAYDLLVISTPDDTHGRILLKAISEGVDTFVEKPAVYNASESEELRSLLSIPRRGKFTTNTILRTTPFANYFRDNIFGGLLGEILYFEAKYLYGRWSKVTQGWRGKIPDYSVTLGGGIHMIDLICFLVDDFNGTSRNFRFKSHEDESLQINDVGITLLSLSKGHAANISSVFASPTQHERSLECYGDRGWFQLKGNSLTTSDNLSVNSLDLKNIQHMDKGILLKRFLEAKKSGWPKAAEQNFPSEEQVLNVVDFCIQNQSH
jgi:predicted dehydrogenase